MNEYLTILAFTVAGLVWNNLGYLSAWRKYKNTPEWTGFEPKKLRDDLILGTILGLGAYLLSVYQGDITSIETLQAFLTVVAGGFAIVAVVDKAIVGGVIGK